MFDEFVKSRNSLNFVIPSRKRESSSIKQFWAPASTGATAFMTFYGVIMFGKERKKGKERRAPDLTQHQFLNK